MPRSQVKYVGRFAPTPSGPLHFGSIIAALGSYLDARHHQGRWLLRIDDLDTPRLQAGADDKILAALETLGLHWDGMVVYQSRRHEAYQHALANLQSRDLLFPCYCPRKLVKGRPYPGTCRQREVEKDRQHALRIKVAPGTVVLHDLIQTEYRQNLLDEVGDFIIRRADGLYAYHLAVVLDDAWQGITHIVRGADLMASTPRQIYLQQQLAVELPVYAHLPLAVSQTGVKISKQSMAKDVLLLGAPNTVLFNCLNFLGQQPEADLSQAPVRELIQWGIEHWQLSRVPKLGSIIAPEKYRTT